MYLDCKKYKGRVFVRFSIIIFTFFTLTTNESNAQNVTSPYSILGIGDVDTKDFGRYFSSGNASLARREENAYNFSNPASITVMPYKVLNFDIAMRGRSSSFQLPGQGTETKITKDFIIKRVSIAFKVTEKSGFALGLRPFSTVNFKYFNDQKILDGNTTYTKSVEGDGGINQVYFSFANQQGKHFSAGLTGSFLFGSLKRQTQYLSNNIDLYINKEETDFYNGASLQGGVQYYSANTKKWQHKIGITATANTQLRGQLTTTYSQTDTTAFKTETDNERFFKMPLSIGIGYSVTFKKAFTFSLDGNYYQWPYQKVNYSGSYTDNSFRISSGIEYSKKITRGAYSYEKYYVGLGSSVENNYIKIKGKNLIDYSFSFGAGYNLARNIFIHGGFEVGKKGNIGNNQIRENYNQFITGITIRDVFFSTRKLGRYD